MSGLLFAYDVLLLLALAGAVAGFVIAYVQKREPLLLWVAIFFLAIVSDHTYLFFVESVGGGAVPEGTVALSVMYVLLGFVVLVGERMIASHCFDWKVSPLEWTLMGVLLLGFLADALVRIPGALAATFSVVQMLYSIFILAWSIYLLISRRGDIEPGHYRFLLVLLLVTLVTMLVGHAIDWSQASLLLFSSERVLFSEVLTVEYLVFAYVYLVRLFKTVTNPEVARAAALDGFGRTHDLTAREREILGLIVDGRSNQEIGNELWLSVGTVKTHAHNIYRKVGVAKRAELLAAFDGYEKTVR